MRLKLKRRQSPILILVIVVFVLIGQHFGWFAKAQQRVIHNDPGFYSIDHFVDGDTIAINMNGTVETIRMIGVDTPETHKPNSPIQCYGPAAAAYTNNLIGKNPVRLEADSLNENRDRYDRLLRYVYLPDRRLVQEELIKNGYGFAYTLFPFSKSELFVAQESTAKAQNIGLWGNCNVSIEKNGRKQTNSIIN